MVGGSGFESRSVLLPTLALDVSRAQAMSFGTVEMLGLVGSARILRLTDLRGLGATTGAGFGAKPPVGGGSVTVPAYVVE